MTLSEISAVSIEDLPLEMREIFDSIVGKPSTPVGTGMEHRADDVLPHTPSSLPLPSLRGGTGDPGSTIPCSNDTQVVQATSSDPESASRIHSDDQTDIDPDLWSIISNVTYVDHPSRSEISTAVSVPGTLRDSIQDSEQETKQSPGLGDTSRRQLHELTNLASASFPTSSLSNLPLDLNKTLPRTPALLDSSQGQDQGRTSQVVQPGAASHEPFQDQDDGARYDASAKPRSKLIPEDLLPSASSSGPTTSNAVHPYLDLKNKRIRDPTRRYACYFSAGVAPSIQPPSPSSFVFDHDRISVVSSKRDRRREGMEAASKLVLRKGRKLAGWEFVKNALTMGSRI